MRAVPAGRICLRVWQPISTVPLGRDLELAVIDSDGVHALVFPCRRLPDGWIKSETGERVAVRPTHWREWSDRDRPERVRPEREQPGRNRP